MMCGAARPLFGRCVPFLCSDRLGNLAHAAAVDAHTGEILGQVGDGVIQPEEAKARRAQQGGKHFGAKTPIAIFKSEEPPIKAEDVRICP